MKTQLIVFVLVLIVGIALGQEEMILVSVQNEDEDGVLLKMNPDGTGVSTLFSFQGLPSTGDGDIDEIRLSPSGRYIAVDSNHDRWNNPARRNIFAINSDGGSWTQLTPAPNSDDYSYAGPTGSISGSVTWGGDAVAYATVTCQGVAGEYASDGAGNYSVTGVPPGTKMVFAYTWGGSEIVYGQGCLLLSCSRELNLEMKMSSPP